MISPGEDREDGGLDGRPVVQDQGGVEPKGRETEGRGDGVADEIPVATLAVVAAAVGFDDEAITDDDVDSSDARYRHLGEALDPEEVKPVADQGLEPAVSISPGDLDERSDAGGHRGPQPVELRAGQQPLPEGGFECAEERLRAGASRDLREAVGEAYRDEGVGLAPPVPVDDEPRRNG